MGPTQPRCYRVGAEVIGWGSEPQAAGLYLRHQISSHWLNILIGIPGTGALQFSPDLCSRHYGVKPGEGAGCQVLEAVVRLGCLPLGKELLLLPEADVG